MEGGEKENIKKVILIRVYLCLSLMILFGGCIIFKIVRTQTIDGEKWKSFAKVETRKYVNIEPIRGNIYACDGSILSTSIPFYDIRFDASVKANPDSIWNKGIDSLAFNLSHFFKDKSIADWKKELNKARSDSSKYYLIHKKVYHTELTLIRNFPIFRGGKVKKKFYKCGLIEERISQRIRTFQLADRTIGRFTDNQRPYGMELAYNKYLQGNAGSRLFQKIAGGQWIPVNDDNNLDPKDGQDIITTLDVNIQDAANTALKSALIKNGADHGCAIVMDVKTGAIKAIANLGKLSEDRYAEIDNYALKDATEPGSTFKVVSAMALLDLTSVTSTTKVDTRGGKCTFHGAQMSDSHEGGYGVVSLEKGFAVSSNVAISTLVVDQFSNRRDDYLKYIYRLKLNQKLGLDLSGEGNPKFKGIKDWSAVTLPWMSVGYEILMTPIQTATLYNAIANNGKMVKPQFITEVKELGKTVYSQQPEVMVQQICKPKTLESIKQMLQSVVDYGTATNLKNDLFKVSGKTGTAQMASKKGGYKKNLRYQASFAGFFPSDDPKYTIVVVINNPTKGDFYGASVAAPVFKEIAEKIYASTTPSRQYLDLFSAHKRTLPLAGNLSSEDAIRILNYQKYNTSFMDSMADWVNFQKTINGSMAYNTIVLPEKKSTIPDCTGMTLADAFYILENRGAIVEFNGNGKVVSQSIEPGNSIKNGTHILLTLKNN